VFFRQYFVNPDDTVTQKVRLSFCGKQRIENFRAILPGVNCVHHRLQIVVHKTSARGTHFRRAGPRQRVYFQSDEVNAAIVTCGGLCPGLNTVVRELVCGLYDMYGVTSVVGIEVRSCRVIIL
jgi:6-phosphofructokinase 1